LKGFVRCAPQGGHLLPLRTGLDAFGVLLCHADLIFLQKSETLGVAARQLDLIQNAPV
jgi:hypothetical protein